MTLTKNAKKRIFKNTIVLFILLAVFILIFTIQSKVLPKLNNPNNRPEYIADDTLTIANKIDGKYVYDAADALTNEQEQFLEASIKKQLSQNGLNVFVYINRDDVLSQTMDSDQAYVSTIMVRYNLSTGTNVLLYINKDALQPIIVTSIDLFSQFPNNTIEKVNFGSIYAIFGEVFDSAVSYTVNGVYDTYSSSLSNDEVPDNNNSANVERKTTILGFNSDVFFGIYSNDSGNNGVGNLYKFMFEKDKTMSTLSDINVENTNSNNFIEDGDSNAKTNDL